MQIISIWFFSLRRNGFAICTFLLAFRAYNICLFLLLNKSLECLRAMLSPLRGSVFMQVHGEAMDATDSNTSGNSCFRSDVMNDGMTDFPYPPGDLFLHIS